MSTTSEIVATLKRYERDADSKAAVAARTEGLEQAVPHLVKDADTLRAAANRLSELERENAALREALRETKFFLLMLHGSCRSDGHGYSNVNIPNVDLAELREKVRAALAGSGEK